MTYYSSADLANAFRTVRKNTLQVAHDIPADKFDYRATGDTRSVGETFAHIAANTQWIHKAHGVDKATSLGQQDFGKYIGDAHAYAATLTTRDAIVAALEANGKAFGDWLATLDEATLAEKVAFAPPIQPASKTRFEMLLSAKEHEMHHRAQLMLIQRMLGVVPHLTRARQAR
jgi:uncharacterized damage-inducible protein DinB